MITIVEKPGEFISAFNDSIFKLTTSETDAVKGVVRDGSTILGTQYSVRIGGEFTFNFKGLLSTIMFNYDNPLLTTTSVDTLTTSSKTNAIKKLIIEFEEVNDSPDTWEDDFIIHRGSLNDRGTLWDTSGIDYFLPLYEGDRYLFKGDIIPLSFMGVSGNYSIGINGTPTPITISQNFNNYTYKTEEDVLTITTQDRTINYFLIKKPTRGKTLYWLNKWGAWEQFSFVDYDERQIIEKENYYTYDTPNTTNRRYNTFLEKSETEVKLYSYPIDGNKFKYIKSIMYSPIVVDEMGERVEILLGNLLTDLNDIHTPDITIRYLNKNIMNF